MKKIILTNTKDMNSVKRKCTFLFLTVIIFLLNTVVVNAKVIGEEQDVNANPFNIEVLYVDNSSVELSWDSLPLLSGENFIDSVFITVYLKESGNVEYEDLGTWGTNVDRYVPILTISDLFDGTSYDLYIHEVYRRTLSNGVNYTLFNRISGIITFRTTTDCRFPTEISASVDNNSATISWQYDNDDPFISHNIYLFLVNDINEQDTIIYDSYCEYTSVELTDLDNGSYTVFLTSTCGDSTNTISVTFTINFCNQDLTKIINNSICYGETYNFNGRTLSEAGIYTDSLHTINSCDSIITLTLNVNPTYSDSLIATICNGETYTFNGGTLSEAGIYTDSLQTTNGCDSVITLTLNVNPTYNDSIEATICDNQTYNFNGRTLTQTGIYTDSLQTVNGCDSVVTLALNVNNTYRDSLFATIWENNVYNFNGRNISQQGVYYDNLQTVNGCDSVIVLTLDIVKATLTTNVWQTSVSLTANFIAGRDVQTRGLIFNGNVVAADSNNTLLTYINSLTPSTNYNYKAFIVLNSGDTLFGSEQYLKTLDIVVTSSQATDINKTTATLNGNALLDSIPLVNVTNMGFIVTKPTQIDTLTVTTTGGAYSYNITGLDSNTNYSYLAFVKAYDTVYLSGEQQFKTLAFDKQGDIFAIRTKEDLCLLGYFVNNSTNSSDYNAYSTAQYVLMNDIHLEDNTTNNITSIGSIVRPFSGRFDGNNHIIYNVNIERLQDSCQGLFGYTRNAGIYNLGIANINVVSKKYTGGMVGYAKNTYIKNCYVQGGNLYATSYSGGLIGYQTAGDSSIISGCYNTCTVEGNNYIGGLLGYSNNGVVRNSYVAAPIIGHGNVGIGAIIGGAIDVLTYNFYFSTLITGQTNAVGIFDGIGSKYHNTKAGEGLADTTMRSDAFVNMLNTNMSVAAWKHDYDIPINDGFPILVWQDGVNLTVSTLLAEDVTSNSVKLRGNIEVEGGQVESKGFMWKQSSDSSWQSVNVLAEDFEYVITGLEPSVSYLYHAFASIGQDTVFGEDITFTTLSGVALDEVTLSDNITLYPNPASSEAKLSLSNIGKADIIIYDVKGRVVWQQKVDSNQSEVVVDVKGFAKGTYMVVVKGSSKKVNRKLIVE